MNIAKPEGHVLFSSNRAVELDVDSYIVPRKLPRVEIQPIVWNFDLISIHNLLLEDTISITESVAPCRIVQSGQAVKEAGCKSTKATVSESSIVLLRYDIFNSEA